MEDLLFIGYDDGKDEHGVKRDMSILQIARPVYRRGSNRSMEIIKVLYEEEAEELYQTLMKGV